MDRVDNTGFVELLPTCYTVKNFETQNPGAQFNRKKDRTENGTETEFWKGHLYELPF